MTPSSSSIIRLPLAIRDTALTVAALHAGEIPRDGFAVFRQTCEAQLARLRIELTEAREPPDVIDDALYAQCALLDEAVLSCLKAEDRDQWERLPLQVTQFRSHDAGEQLIARMQMWLTATQANQRLLLIFHTVLLLGFKGKFTPQDEAQRIQLISDLAARIERCGGNIFSEECATIVVTNTKPRRRWPHFSPLLWVLLATLATIATYLGLRHWLSMSIKVLTQ
ncbi:type VI secretion system protein ImpK [Herbaspirillum sp. Sphag1AN]|uniref:DotU/TssL family secretion system protein n=1 Tax=unclassified Herbaspirillum TaxID=2624150 RepID=UPI001606FAFC|nr:MULTISPECIES: DotU/TssL family secretion system protein [unclassified Herbaspirillum]MBB3213274.1 type VI secretion system protein ImpK [Herbaspirillum sp. Sphag1AN]MBB3246471.1 type VI secretion system protein ImpK [Herbaspirillum sp. Sphag64]